MTAGIVMIHSYKGKPGGGPADGNHPHHGSGSGSTRSSPTSQLSGGGGGGSGSGGFHSRLTGCFWFFLVMSLLCMSGYFFRDYIRRVLVVVEHQDDVAIIAVLTLLYVLVSLPFAWGYLVINIATGYLYGLVKGLLVTMFTATLGILIAHFIIKKLLTKYVRRYAKKKN